MKLPRHFIILIILSLGPSAWALSLPAPAGEKGLVVVFVSAKCPCSDSHLKELKSVAEKYKKFKFVGVHANADEGLALSKSYFDAAHLPFEVIEDGDAKLANEFKALKTPHAFVLSPQGEVLYQGGVTNSANGSMADKHFLAEALEDVQESRNVRTKYGRTLGCIIQRPTDKNIW
jgi:hypothetical protein